MNNLKMIAAASDPCRVIGINNTIPWHNPTELSYFKSITVGGAIVMGSNTFESIGKRKLPGRITFVLTSDASKYADTGVITVSSKAELDVYIKSHPIPFFIVGGASLYEMYIDEVSEIYLTDVDIDVNGDTHFPEFDVNEFHAFYGPVVDDHRDECKWTPVFYRRKGVF